MDFTRKAFLLVKSTNHFHAGFQPISSEIVYIAAPTSYPVSYTHLDVYKRQL